MTVTGPPWAICALNFGTTEPLEPSTLPKRTEISRVRVCARSSASVAISAKRLVAPSIETGWIALSVEIITMACASAAMAASATLIEPKTFVFTPSGQSCSR